MALIAMGAVELAPLPSPGFFLQPSLRDVVVLGVLASSRDPLPSPLFL